MSTLYFKGDSGTSDYNWSTLTNWYTDAAGTTNYGGTDAPWTVDDVTKGYNLAFVDGESTGPSIDINLGDDGSGTPWSITGDCSIPEIYSSSIIYGGTFSGSGFYSVGTINDGTFTAPFGNAGTINDGTFSGNDSANNNGGIINGGTFSGSNFTNNGDIQAGTFNGTVTNVGVIYSGTYNGNVTNDSAINGGTFSGAVTNNSIIDNGTFNGAVINNAAAINGGTFNGTVTLANVDSFITNGTFNGLVDASGFDYTTTIGTPTLGGTFNFGIILPYNTKALYYQRGINGSGILGMV